jgi:hypothetical protein
MIVRVEPVLRDLADIQMSGPPRRVGNMCQSPRHQIGVAHLGTVTTAAGRLKDVILTPSTSAFEGTDGAELAVSAVKRMMGTTPDPIRTPMLCIWGLQDPLVPPINTEILSGDEAMSQAERERQRQLAERARKEIVDRAAPIDKDEELALAA